MGVFSVIKPDAHVVPVMKWCVTAFEWHLWRGHEVPYQVSFRIHLTIQLLLFRSAQMGRGSMSCRLECWAWGGPGSRTNSWRAERRCSVIILLIQYFSLSLACNFARFLSALARLWLAITHHSCAFSGERLIQYATQNCVVEVLIHPQLYTLQQCLKNMLSSFTKHRHLIHAGYTFSGSGSWVLQVQILPSPNLFSDVCKNLTHLFTGWQLLLLAICQNFWRIRHPKSHESLRKQHLNWCKLLPRGWMVTRSFEQRTIFRVLSGASILLDYIPCE